jgi:hypothetical protein
MGKRELLLVLAFALIGTGVYQLTVVRRQTDRQFSLRTAIESLRPGRRDRATASVHRTGALPVDAGVTELKLAGFSTVVLTGEDRADVAYDVTFESNGADEAAARGATDQASIVSERLGAVFVVTTRGVAGSRLNANATLKIPARLQVTIENTRTADIRGVAAVALFRMTGEAQLQSIHGLVSGSHRNGRLTISNAGRVDVAIISSDLELSDVHEGVRLAFRNGSARLAKTQGLVDIDGESYRLVMTEAASTVKVAGADAEVRLERPRGPVRLETRRTSVFVEVDRPVPMMIYTTERKLEVQVDDTLPVTIDARAIDGGRIDASALGLTAEQSNGEAQLRHRVGDAAEIVLRNQHGEIEIDRRKW